MQTTETLEQLAFIHQNHGRAANKDDNEEIHVEAKRKRTLADGCVKGNETVSQASEKLYKMIYAVSDPGTSVQDITTISQIHVSLLRTPL